MKVAYICADPGIPVFGTKGASVHVQEVIKGMLRLGAEITLFAQRTDGEIPKELANIRIIKLAKLPQESKEARAQGAIAANKHVIRLLEENGPFDLIYERYSLWSHAGMSFSKKYGCTGMLEVNAPLIEEQKRYRELPLENEAQRITESVFRDADAIICVSPGVKNYVDNFPQTAGKTRVISNGVNITRFTPASKKNAARLAAMTAQGNAGENGFTVGFLGTLKPWHGISALVEAWAILRKRGYSAHLLIVGDGPQYDALHTDIENKGLLEYATFTGAILPEHVAEYLAQMDIAAAPYPKMDNFYFSPMKIYEYMAAGIPTITTKVGHLETVIDNNYNGLLVEADNPRAMADCIAALFDDVSEMRRLGLNARKTAEKNHSWLSVAERILIIAEKAKAEK